MLNAAIILVPITAAGPAKIHWSNVVKVVRSGWLEEGRATHCIFSRVSRRMSRIKSNWVTCGGRKHISRPNVFITSASLDSWCFRPVLFTPLGRVRQGGVDWDKMMTKKSPNECRVGSGEHSRMTGRDEMFSLDCEHNHSSYNSNSNSYRHCIYSSVCIIMTQYPPGMKVNA